MQRNRRPAAVCSPCRTCPCCSGRSFFIDPTRGVYHETNNRAGGFRLRRVAIDYRNPPDFKLRRDDSRGRFPDSADGMVLHPHGYLFAIRRGTHKLYRITLPDSATSDEDAPMATLCSGEGSRHGLMKSPMAVALALDGCVLMLESGNGKRVQCFDVNGNPVAYFTDPVSKNRTPVLALRSEGGSLTLLDMAVEAKGHIFILGYTGSGKKPEDYRLDLYDPAGTYLTSTGNFTAGRITVDLLRNVFALNYEVLDTNSPEPGVSQWRPPAPSKPRAWKESDNQSFLRQIPLHHRRPQAGVLGKPHRPDQQGPQESRVLRFHTRRQGHGRPERGKPRRRGFRHTHQFFRGRIQTAATCRWHGAWRHAGFPPDAATRALQEVCLAARQGGDYQPGCEVVCAGEAGRCRTTAAARALQICSERPEVEERNRRRAMRLSQARRAPFPPSLLEGGVYFSADSFGWR